MTVVTTLYYDNIITDMYQIYSKKELKSLINIGFMKSCDVYDLNTMKTSIKYNSSIKNEEYVGDVIDIVMFYLNNIQTKYIKKEKLARIIHNVLCGVALNDNLLNQITKVDKKSSSNETTLEITIKYKKCTLAVLKTTITNIGKDNNKIKVENEEDNGSDEDTFSVASDDSDDYLDYDKFLMRVDNIMINGLFENNKLVDNPNVKLLNFNIIEGGDFVNEECIVCLDKDNVSVTSCGHFIHKECLLLVDNIICPVCRTSLKKYIKTFVNKKDRILLRYFNYEKKLIDDYTQSMEHIINEVFSSPNGEVNYSSFCLIYINMFDFILRHNKYNVSAIFDIILTYTTKSYLYFKRIVDANIKDGVFVYNFKNVDTLLNYILNLDCEMCLSYVLNKKIKKYYKGNLQMHDKKTGNINVIIKIGDSTQYHTIKPQETSLKNINFRSRLLAFLNFDKNWILEDEKYNINSFEYIWCKNFYNNIKKN
jgi:hypothetical protein